MPRVGDSFTRGDLRFEVVDLDRRRIDKVLIERQGGLAGVEQVAN
jgi:CBS domain containing-hemolysin-like protein